MLAKVLMFGLMGGLLLTEALSQRAIAQVTVRSTGIVTGTVTPPSRNPTFNQGTTRVDTDAQGRYRRNGTVVFDAQAVNPNLVRLGANGQYFVDFRGIPVVSVDGTLSSPVLNGQLTQTQRFNNDAPVRYWGNIQDEFVVQGNFVGTATDPVTGAQYQGTFPIRGQGPRYSDANGGSSPTVFDFRSYYNFQADPAINPTPTVFSYPINSMPVNLSVTIPAGLAPIVPGMPALPSTPIGPGIAPSLTPPPTPTLESLVFSGTSRLEVNHLVLQPAVRPAVNGPVSRILQR
ncbi:MAG: hypothetical protein RLZZ511_1890 [Cyanobacteriota bacterium]|jgi:hypothetical protein